MSTLSERQRQYRLLAEATAEVRYCYEFDAQGGMVRRWIAGSFPGVEDALPARVPPEGCWLQVAHPDDRERVRARLERLQRGERSIDEFRVVLPGSGVRWMRVFGLPERDRSGERVVRLLGAAQDITGHREVLEAAHRSAEQLRLVTENLPVLISQAGPDQRYRLVSEAYERWLGMPREQILGKTIRELMGDDAYEGMQPQLEDVLRGRVASLETTLQLPDGRARRVVVTMVPGAASDPAQGFYILITDITELKEAERQQGLLVSELDHRVKNVLAVVQAMVKLTARAQTAGRDFATVLLGRIQALASAHDLLARNRWRGADLGELVHAALSPFESSEALRITIAGEPLLLAARAAGSIAVICHELAVNAARYGALSTPAGRVEVRWRTTVKEGEGRLELEWEETSDRRVSPPERRGFGTLMVERAAAYELSGEAHVAFSPGGLHYRLDVPLAEIAAPPTAEAPEA